MASLPPITARLPFFFGLSRARPRHLAFSSKGCAPSIKSHSCVCKAGRDLGGGELLCVSPRACLSFGLVRVRSWPGGGLVPPPLPHQPPSASLSLLKELLLSRPSLHTTHPPSLSVYISTRAETQSRINETSQAAFLFFPHHSLCGATGEEKKKSPSALLSFSRARPGLRPARPASFPPRRPINKRATMKAAAVLLLLGESRACVRAEEREAAPPPPAGLPQLGHRRRRRRHPRSFY